MEERRIKVLGLIPQRLMIRCGTGFRSESLENEGEEGNSESVLTDRLSNLPRRVVGLISAPALPGSEYHGMMVADSVAVCVKEA